MRSGDDQLLCTCCACGNGPFLLIFSPQCIICGHSTELCLTCSFENVPQNQLLEDLSSPSISSNTPYREVHTQTTKASRPESSYEGLETIEMKTEEQSSKVRERGANPRKRSQKTENTEDNETDKSGGHSSQDASSSALDIDSSQKFSLSSPFLLSADLIREATRALPEHPDSSGSALVMSNLQSALTEDTTKIAVEDRSRRNFV